jgi:hypothetical protein
MGAPLAALGPVYIQFVAPCINFSRFGKPQYSLYISCGLYVVHDYVAHNVLSEQPVLH